jgi:hypothetical protein
VNRSQSLASLAKALAVAQAEMHNPAFDSVNPHFRNKFASLISVREAVIPVLTKHGLSLAQFPISGEGSAGVVNVLMHSSGEWLEETCLLPLTKNDAQGAGSAITYARRYSLQSIAAVAADEDDDANTASKPPAQKAARDPIHPTNANSREVDFILMFKEAKTLPELVEIFNRIPESERGNGSVLKNAAAARRKELGDPIGG